MNKHKLWILFLTTFKLSASTFGGGFVIIPLMKKKIVDDLKWIEEEEMMDLTAIAQSSPGAIAVNASVLVGYHVSGILGSIVSVLGSVLPPLIIISIISLFYASFRDNVIVNLIMKGMLAGIAAVVLDVVYQMIKDIIKNKNILSLLIFILAFIASYFFNVNVLIILFVCGVIGAFHSIYKDRREGIKKQ